MKKTLLAFTLFSTAFSWSQREMDLAVSITSPANNSEVPLFQNVYFDLQISNQGPDDFLAADSVYLYIAINDIPMVFQPGNQDHVFRTGNTAVAGGMFNTSIPIAFANGYENTTNEMCITVIPMNSMDGIQEVAIEDNTYCVTFTVVDNNAGLEESALNSANGYPNPAKDFFQLSESADQGIAELYNLEGKRVARLSVIQNRFDINQIENGTYLLKYSANSIQKTTRLIVAH